MRGRRGPISQKNINQSNNRTSRLKIIPNTTSRNNDYSDYYYNDQEDEYSRNYESSDDNLPNTRLPMNPRQAQPYQSNVNHNVTPRGRRPVPMSQNSPPQHNNYQKQQRSEQNDKSEDENSFYSYGYSYEDSNQQISQPTPRIQTNNIYSSTLPTTPQNVTNPYLNSNQNATSTPQINSNITTPSISNSNTNSPPNNVTSDSNKNTANTNKTLTDKDLDESNRNIFISTNQIKIDGSGPLIATGQMSFQISYNKKINAWKRTVKMTNNDRMVYCCHAMSDKTYGKIHVICTSSDVNIESPSCVGIIVRHRMGTRYTLLKKENGATNFSQIAGIAFIDLDGKDRQIRHFKLALANPEGPPYHADTKDMDLSRVAMRGEDIEGVKIYSSAMPEKLAHGKLYIDMGPYKKKSSTKNFIIRDDDGSPMFVIFKAIDNMCKVKTREPISPLIAFSLSVAIVTSYN